MAGFLNTANNIEFKNALLGKIIQHLLYCSDMMATSCHEQKRAVDNDENKIRNHLLENYLNKNKSLHLRFEPETQENYDSDTDTYYGRADIKVLTENWFYEDIADYYIIECKRIDGSALLNKKYVEEGICRFVTEPVKYSSYNNSNIIFGFVVKQFDINENAKKINCIQKTIIGTIKNEFALLAEINKGYVYSSSYNLKAATLELNHIFYDFSAIVN